jgi:NADPH:quinone reductase-like Zn-dependent oxidoreductase
MLNRRVVITEKGGPEVLQLITEELAPPAAGQAQVRVLASGVAFGDVFKRRRLGTLMGSPKIPFTPGYDLVGVVESVGPDVARVKPGDRVAAFVVNGANAERVNVRDDLLVPIPEGVDAVDAVCLVLNYVTAEQMLHRVARVRAGERILVHGAAGGVGTALLELGRLDGLEMYGTASAGKHPTVRELGATPIDYRNQDFVERVLALTKDGVDLVLDPIGGPNLQRSRATLRQGGMLVIYGASAAIDGGLSAFFATFARFFLYKLAADGRSYRFYGIHDQPSIQADLRRLLGLLAEKKLRPIVGARLPLTEAARAHQMLESAAVIGKIVLVSE